MKNVDYIIVGDGYAGYFFAHQLIKNKKSFILFSEGKKSASKVSAGMINPVVLKKFTTFWLAQEQILFLKQTLAEIETYTHKNYLIEETVHRIFHDENEKQLWLKKSENVDLSPFLNQNFKTFRTINNPYEAGEVLQSARLDVPSFFADLENYLYENAYLVNERFDYNKINIEDKSYRDIHFSNIVFCEGMSVRENPFFSGIEVHPNKGHHLHVRLSQEIEDKATFKKKHFLFPLEDKIYYYGGTYDREQTDRKIDDSAVSQLKNGLSEIYSHDFKIISTEVGFRPTVKDRRPILGQHLEFEDLFVFNGLGARGVLNGCYFAKELFDFIEYNKPLHPEVDFKRFIK